MIVDGHPRRLTPAEAIQHGQHLVGDIESSGVTSRDETWHAVARFFDGTVELTSLTLTAPPGKPLSTATLTQAVDALRDGVDASAAGDLEDLFGSDVVSLLDLYYTLRQRRPVKRRKWDRNFLDAAAMVYRQAELDELPPRQAVARAFDLGPDAASQVIRKARDAGLIPPVASKR